MPIVGFASDLAEAFSREPMPPSVMSEEEFERRFVIPVATRVGARHADVLL